MKKLDIEIEIIELEQPQMRIEWEKKHNPTINYRVKCNIHPIGSFGKEHEKIIFTVDGEFCGAMAYDYHVGNGIHNIISSKTFSRKPKNVNVYKF
jgi:hypothetical protein